MFFSRPIVSSSLSSYSSSSDYLPSLKPGMLVQTYLSRNYGVLIKENVELNEELERNTIPFDIDPLDSYDPLTNRRYNFWHILLLDSPYHSIEEVVLPDISFYVIQE